MIWPRFGVSIFLVLAAWVVGSAGNAAWGDEAVTLRETSQIGDAITVLIEMNVAGNVLHETSEGKNLKPAPLKVESRLEFVERVLRVGEDGQANRVARRVQEGLAAIAGQKDLVRYRPEVALLIAEKRDAGVVVVSPSGPLMRSELDLVQAPGDPLGLQGLLPDHPVKLGAKWPISDAAARSLSDYDVLASNRLEAKLDTLDDAQAIILIGGAVRGSARGGEGTITTTGRLRFDRKTGRIARLELSRAEVRKRGPVELGLDVKSSLTVERSGLTSAPGLGDDVLAALPRDSDPRREWLVLHPTGTKFHLEHDRDWHLTYEDPRQCVLKKIENGAMLAHCRLSVGPNAGKGRHQDPGLFRDDVRKAVGDRFVELSEAVEADDRPDENFVYKVSVLAQERDLGILWYYYLIASPDGDQVLATFTLEKAAEKRFGDGDRRLVETISWRDGTAPPPSK